MKLTLFIYSLTLVLLSGACQKKASETVSNTTDSTQVVTTVQHSSTTNKATAINIKTFFEQQIKKSYPNATTVTTDEIKVLFVAMNGTEKTIGSVCQWESPKGDIFTVFTYNIAKGKISLDKNNLKVFDAQGKDLTTTTLDWALIDTAFKNQLREAPARGFTNEKDFVAEFPDANFDHKTLSIQLADGKEVLANDGGGSRVIVIEFEWNSKERRFIKAPEMQESPF